MPPVVIIPLAYDSTQDFITSVNMAIAAWRGFGYDVILAMNGHSDGDGLDFMSGPLSGLKSGPGIYRIHASPFANPYPARNAAARTALFRRYEHLIFSDADCQPAPNYKEVLEKYLSTDYGIIAGRVETAIPDKRTGHFRQLRAVKFECYGDHLDPKLPVGANMVVHQSAWRTFGPFGEDRSGGDGIIGLKMAATGKPVTVAQDLVVTKTVFGMSLLGIMQKQLLNGACFPQSMIPPLPLAKKALLANLRQAAASLEAGDYPDFVDRIFKLGVSFATFAAWLDAEE